MMVHKLAPILAIGFAIAIATPAAAEVIELISKSSAGVQANGRSSVARQPVISANNLLVVFDSVATNLVADDLNDKQDVFLHDRETGETELISISSGDVQGNSHSLGAAISADGRYVAFSSLASNLVPNDTNGRQDTFVRDRLTGTTRRISVGSDGGQANNTTRTFTMSPSGRFIVFMSLADNLVDGDTNSLGDIFLHDRDFDEDGIFDEPGAILTERVSVNSLGEQTLPGPSGFGFSSGGSVSADGRFVAFTSPSRNLVFDETLGAQDCEIDPLPECDTNKVTDVFVHDRQTGRTTMISADEFGNEGSASDPMGVNIQPDSFAESISADGRFVIFLSRADNLVPGDVNEFGAQQAFVHDLQTGMKEKISFDNSGKVASNTSGRPTISADGRFAAFTGFFSADCCSSSIQGQFLRDRLTGLTEQLDVTASGEQGTGFSGIGLISPDGRFLVFSDSGRNLVPGGDNGVSRTNILLARPSGTTETGSNVIVEPMAVGDDGQALDESPVTFTFDNISDGGTTTVEVSNTGPAVPTGFQLGDPPTFFDLETTAAFTGSIEICIDYGGISFPDETRLRLLHFDETKGIWKKVKTTFLDTTNDVICGSVNSLSTFSVAELANQPPVVNAGLDQTVEATGASTEVTLDGSASSDPDGDTLIFSWSGPFGVAGGQSPNVSLALGVHDVSLSVSDGVNPPVQGTVTITVEDTTPPDILSTPLPDIIVDATGASTIVTLGPPTVIDLADLAPLVTNNAPTSFPVGITTVTWTATDAQGNVANAEQTVDVRYIFGEFRPPLVDRETYKANRTLPVKFQLFFVGGIAVPDAVITIEVVRVRDANSTDLPIDLSTDDDADNGPTFRYDPVEGQYIFNLSTKGFEPGWYQITAVLTNGQRPSIEIDLK